MLSDGTYRIKKGPDIGKVAEVTIPAEIDGIKVTQVAGFAFDKCYDLKVINIPDTVQYIDILGKAFNQCTRLQAINVYHVEGNNEIVYKSENGILLAYDKNGTQKLELGFVPVTMQGKFEIPAGVEVIPEKIFAKSAITEIVIPASVSIIEANAFLNCAQLQKVTFLPAEAGQTAVELTIGQNAFNGCGNVKNIVIPSTVTTIYENAFSNCTKLETVITSSNLEIKDNAFNGCAKLKYFGEQVASIPNYVIDFNNVVNAGAGSFDLGDQTYTVINATGFDLESIFGQTKIAE
jgi:hypothetical protein